MNEWMIENAVKVKITDEDRQTSDSSRPTDKVGMHYDCYRAFSKQSMTEYRYADHNNTEYYNSIGKLASFDVACSIPPSVDN